MGADLHGRSVGTDGAALDSHLSDLGNPHQVMAAQLGVTGGGGETKAGGPQKTLNPGCFTPGALYPSGLTGYTASMQLPYWFTGLRRIAYLLPGVLFALTAASSPVGAATGLASTVLSMQGIDCQGCGMAAAAKLKGSEGVEEVSFDRGKAELAVDYDPSATDPATLASSVGELGYTVVVGEGKGRYLPDVEFSSELDVSWASRDGEAVDIEEHLAEGKVTVIDFYARWCGPCRLVDREMFSILRARDDVALRKVNVNDWGSPVARQYLRKVPELPYVIVYSKTGRKVKAITGLDLQGLRAAIESGASGG